MKILGLLGLVAQVIDPTHTEDFGSHFSLRLTHSDISAHGAGDFRQSK
jgi:hypothetical protein